MKVLACTSDWHLDGGSPVCPGTFEQVDASQIPQGISLEEAKELSGDVIALFAIVAGFLIIQRALK